MMRYKRFIIVGVFCVTLGGLLTSQGLATPQGEFAGTTITILAHSGHKQYLPALEKILEFERQTGIKVEVVKVPWDQIHSKIIRDVVLGVGKYDTFDTPSARFPGLYPYMASLEPFLEADGINPDEWKTRFAPWAIDQVSYRGEMKFYTYYSGTWSGIYRKDLFEDPEEKVAFKQKYGYELAPPKTLQQLVDVGQFFTRDTDDDGDIDLWGVIFSASETGPGILDPLLFKAGLPYQDEDGYCLWGERYPENRETVKEIARFVQDLSEKYRIVTPAFKGMGTSEVADFYMSGRVATVLDMVYFIWDDVNSTEVVARIGPSGDFQFPPPGEGGIPFHWAWPISGLSKNKGATWEFLKWFLSEDNIKLDLTEGIGVFIPTELSLAAWAAEKGIIPQSAAEEIANCLPFRLHVAIGEVRNVILDRAKAELHVGNITPEEFVEMTSGEMDRLMFERGLLGK